MTIGRTVIRDLPAGLPQGWPVDVTFRYGTNGRLAVEALVPGTNHQSRLELVRETGLSNEGLARWKQPIESAGGIDVFACVAKDLQETAVLEMQPPSGNTDWGPAAGAGVPPLGGNAVTSPAKAVTMDATAGANKPDEPAVPLISRKKQPRDRRIPLWLERLIGHIITMIIFAFVGYLMISHLRPDVFPSLFGRDKPTSEQKQPERSP